MPVVRRGTIGRRHGDLTEREIHMLAGPPILWREPFREMPDPELRALYTRHRDVILAANRWPGERPELFWRFEPEVPAELRDLPERVNDGGRFLATGIQHPTWVEHERVEYARRDWLLKQTFFRE